MVPETSVCNFLKTNTADIAQVDFNINFQAILFGTKKGKL